MRDIKLLYDDEGTLDIDIIQGEPSYVDSPQNTEDQRAAVAAYIAKGSVPGAPDLGIDWFALDTRHLSLLDIDNQVKMQIASITAKNNYTPLYATNEGKLAIGVVRAEVSK